MCVKFRKMRPLQFVFSALQTRLRRATKQAAITLKFSIHSYFATMNECCRQRLWYLCHTDSSDQSKSSSCTPVRVSTHHCMAICPPTEARTIFNFICVQKRICLLCMRDAWCLGATSIRNHSSDPVGHHFAAAFRMWKHILAMPML